MWKQVSSLLTLDSKCGPGERPSAGSVPAPAKQDAAARLRDVRESSRQGRRWLARDSFDTRSLDDRECYRASGTVSVSLAGMSTFPLC